MCIYIYIYTHIYIYIYTFAVGAPGAPAPSSSPAAERKHRRKVVNPSSKGWCRKEASSKGHPAAERKHRRKSMPKGREPKQVVRHTGQTSAYQGHAIRLLLSL